MLMHVLVLVVAATAAVVMWTREKQPVKALVSGDITVWTGRAADVQKIAYVTKTRKVAIEVKEDAAGRFLTGTAEKEPTPPKATKDAGPPPKPPTKTTTTLMSVGEGQKLIEALATLKALRGLGKVPDDRLGEFGLKEPEGTLTVNFAGSDRKLLVGASTPGSGDRYVRDPGTGDVYALKGDLVRLLDGAESRLVEKDLHEWKDADVQSATLKAGDKSRQVVRGSVESKRFWADKESPTTNDETLGNWMTKLDRLKPTEYAAAPPEKRETVLRIDYAAGRPLGFLELVKAPNDKGKHDYYVMTERTRLPAKVPQATAEQVEQDLAGVMK